MLLDICDTTRTLITQFPSDGTVESFLKENGLYPSKTYLYLRSQHRDTIFPEFEDKTGGLEQPAILNTSQLHEVPGAGKRIVCSEYVVAHTWKVANVFDVSKTESTRLPGSLMGEVQFLPQKT